MPYHSIDEILRRCRDRACPFWQVVLTTQAKETQLPESAVLDQMDQMAKAMEDSITQYDPTAVTTGKMGGQNGARLAEYNQKGDTLLGDYLSAVIAAAVQVAESNACMKRIVAAPTAGSCGVIPAVLITYQKQQGLPRRELLRALLVSAGIGSVIAENASISGAQGGCQAEIGSAAAMAAGGLVYLAGGDNDAIAQGAAMALKNMLGLVCDPVAGLVETPCIKRNAAGAANAVVAAQMALAGIQSVIPPDEIIDAMYEIGCQLPACLRETSQAGTGHHPHRAKNCRKAGAKSVLNCKEKQNRPLHKAADGLFYPQGHSAQRHIHGHHQGKAGSSAHGAGMTVGAGLGLGVQLLQHHIHHRPGGKSQQKRQHRTQQGGEQYSQHRTHRLYGTGQYPIHKGTAARATVAAQRRRHNGALRNILQCDSDSKGKGVRRRNGPVTCQHTGKRHAHRHTLRHIMQSHRQHQQKRIGACRARLWL